MIEKKMLLRFQAMVAAKCNPTDDRFVFLVNDGTYVHFIVADDPFRAAKTEQEAKKVGLKLLAGFRATEVSICSIIWDEFNQPNLELDKVLVPASIYKQNHEQEVAA